MDFELGLPKARGLLCATILVKLRSHKDGQEFGVLRLHPPTCSRRREYVQAPRRSPFW